MTEYMFAEGFWSGALTASLLLAVAGSVGILWVLLTVLASIGVFVAATYKGE